ncbi:MAG: tRNA (adenosine(37)-N6)-dimethylallyltransferase MiaA [Opitutales bacterium]|nr:tRNA (adenosine(37)-N6)-dimethylallyltransferase MiaA [Opitutales bacterium]MDP4643544.1 tRNA (adenosine(37)-N6)-dimethylallyltransferase MiaA [Opitutales bacterium]MDP4693703.1 tRNA (adenosine(37)-N6)-dimethylallyltransferase MiaA [Opitutales bacterium]MDP4778374.1 tRNA (adenosine(37)-N6)-dimethylallyltransferase MiaA [Opitutales bacterium]MDP4884065.1 tRNA (adenosine(37)-N6)-dimethylallyltransferase MiaA [Opitutales bacterium]
MIPTLHIITGPTAVGKTEYALKYAEQHDAEIVSCDASLVYRGMDIGTAKPTKEELARVPHHLIDVNAVDEPYDIVAYVRDAEAAVADIVARGKSVVVTGGSGFYLKSFFAPVIDIVKVSDAERQQVAALYEAEGLDGLLADLQKRSPEGIGNLDPKNPRRVLRALERCIASGKSLPDLQAEFAARPEPFGEFEKKLILLERDTENLKQRIAQRAQNMVNDGLIYEVEKLVELGIRKNPSASSAIGYRETLAFLDHKLEMRELVPEIVQNTVHLVKKQRTWFRTQIREPDEQINF